MKENSVIGLIGPNGPYAFWTAHRPVRQLLAQAESTPRAILRLEGLRKLNNRMASGDEPVTFVLEAQCLS
jgi:hypothetical protein